MRAVLLALAPLLASSCASPAPWEFTGCDALDESLCALPFPSTFHLRESPTDTGWTLALTSDTLPLTEDGQPLDPTWWNERDGFSVGSPILSSFGDLDPSNLAGFGSIERSQAAESPSILLDVTTGEHVPHWVEVDAHATDSAGKLTILWPAQALDFDHHYIVAYRDLQRVDGAPVDPSPAFEALRAGARSDDPNLTHRRALYEDTIFPELELAGFARDELVLAWDFHTASRGSTIGRLEHMRDDALARLGDVGPDYQILGVTEEDCDTPGAVVWKTLQGRFTVPSYTETPGVNTLLTRGEDGMPFANGEREAGFLVRVPCSVRNDPGPTTILEYGHGLLGDETEARTGWLARYANEHRVVVVAGRQIGMATEDYPGIALMVANDLSRFATLPERLHQGVLEQVLLARLARGQLGTDPELLVDGQRLIGPESEVVWYGNSQGGIVGGAAVGASPDIQRAVLGVGGAPYPLLLPRSKDFEPFFDIFKARYPDALDRMFIIEGLLVQLWDTGESVAWAHEIADDPDKNVLIQIAIGDPQVHRLGSIYQARSMGTALLTPSLRPIWGLETAASPHSGSAYVEYDYGAGDGGDTNLPPDVPFDPHECPRRTPAAQQQAARFLATGVVEDFCDGDCTFEPVGICR